MAEGQGVEPYTLSGAIRLAGGPSSTAWMTFHNFIYL